MAPTGAPGNPFMGPDSDLIIVSIDTLAVERMFGRLQEAATEPYDLVVFDEAHKLSASREPDFRVRKTDRYRLAEALAGGWRGQRTVGASMVDTASAASDGYAAHGQGLSLLLPLAAA